MNSSVMSCLGDGFRLGGVPSECSLKSKAQIDALFEDSKSVSSSTLGGWYAEVSTVASRNSGGMGAEEQKKINSAVQARIEAMFASVEAETGTPGECLAAILSARYLGAAPVGGRVTSIRGLQEPLRDLLEHLEDSSPAELEISRRGLTVRTSESSEKTNPFRRIVVWTALRLRSKMIPSGDLRYAFIPLVGDDPATGAEDKHADLYRTMRGLKRDAKRCVPIFAVVMRRPGATKLLECHAFACQAEEDAVAAAATLYRALLSDLDANRRRPRHKNGVGCVSLASAASSVREPSLSSKNNYQDRPARPTAPHPVRPPRSKKNSISSATEEDPSSPNGQENSQMKKNKFVESEDVHQAKSGRSSIASSSPPAPGLVFGGPQGSNQEVINSNVVQSTHVNLKPMSVNGIVQINNSYKNYEEKIVIPKINDQKVYEQAKKDAKLKVRKQNKTYSENNDDMLSGENKVYRLNGNPQMNGVTYRKCSGAAQETRVSNSKESQRTYDFNPDTRNVSGRGEIYSIVQVNQEHNGKQDKSMFNHKQEINIQDQRQNSKRRSQEKLYEDHFKDADKIHSLNQEESGLKNTKFHQNKDVVYQLRSQDNLSSEGQRISRVSTMDKLLKKPTSDYNDPKALEHYQVGSRNASIDGSEPSNSRLVEAPKVLRENRLKKAQSDLELDRGDLLTRVELPRRGSFFNAGSIRKPANFVGGTPLGFTELFEEFRNQEGLTSIDDILAAIIDPEGMSFNDLKPLYKEFLLKLAATLTRDELYQRSASVMRRRRRPQRCRSTRRPCLLSRAIRRSVSRLRGAPTEFTSVIFPAKRLNTSLGSSSSCEARNNRNRVLASRLGRRRSSRRRVKKGVGHVTSEDSDTGRLLGRAAAANRSSSGYVSCSECSYDSESCTCVSADKCYCSLSRSGPPAPVPGTAVVCSCDTDSCSESNKCYCPKKPDIRHPTILEQLRQRGIVPSESTLSRAGSPERVRTLRTSRSHASSRSLEFLKIRPTPPSSDLALDYDLFNPGKNTHRSSSSEKVMVVSARDTQGRLLYVGGTDSGKRSLAGSNGRSRTHHEALSIKKSAEIAAVFGKGSVRTGGRTRSVSSSRNSASLEAGLGYLP